MTKLGYYKSRFHHPDISQEWISLNNAGLQPITLDAKLDMQMWAERFYKEGFLTDSDYAKAVENTRRNLASLIKCETSEIAFFASTAGGINQIAWKLPLSDQDEVLILEQDYPSLVYPFEQASLEKGYQIRKVSTSHPSLAFDVNQILSQVTQNTKVLAISWYQYQTGATCDFEYLLKKLKEKNIFVLLDVMQGLGLHEFLLWQKGWIDAVVGGSHKWLSSPVGVGFLSLKKDWIPKIGPHNIGALTFGSCDDVAQLNCFMKSDATRYEPASKAAVEISALGKSVELILKTSPSVILDEALRLSKMLESGLLEQGYLVQSPNHIRQHSILNFSHPNKDVFALSQGLKQFRVLHAIRNGGIRLSPAAFNTDDEIEYVLDSLKKL